MTEVDGASARVRVRFPDRQDLVSGWLDVLQRSTHGDLDYGLPPKDTQVAVLMDDKDESGCVLGAIYSAADPPPATAATKRVMQWADGCRIEYDQATHKLTVTPPSGGTVELCGADSAIALATKVQSELSAFRSDYAGHSHQAGPALIGNLGAPVTGVTGAPVAVGYSVGNVGAAQVKSS